MDIMVFGALR